MSNAIIDAFYSLGNKLNKRSGAVSTETQEGVVSEKLPELKLDMENKDIIELTEKWEKSWNGSETKTKWTKKAEENEKYWLGEHFNRPDADKSRAIVDNVIFESLETYLPQVTRRNPEPMVTLAAIEDETPEAQQFAKALQNELGDLADELKIRLKLKKAARHWAISLLGVAKMGWDLNKDIPTVRIVRAQKLILDPESPVDEDGYAGKFIGEYRKMEASSILKIVEGDEEATKVLSELVEKNTGTEIQFIEWWTPTYMCWTMGKNVLLKRKNPHWNYDSETPALADEQGMTPVDENGEPVMDTAPGLNHLAVPGMPYIFLSVFNLGKSPVDDTSLIGQNLSNQDRVNKRIKQIDKNADSMNGGVVVSLARSGLSKEQAKGVTDALRKGGTVAIPDGSPDEAIRRIPGQGLPADVYNDLVDVRNRTKDIFGTRGSSAAGLESDTTVRGKLMNRNLDTDRIGGGVTEYLEQMADEIYNWLVQLLYVYDDRFQGKQAPKIRISVKEGSLLPKDSTTIANQAIELAGAGKMSTIDLYKRLDYPNPEELAANVWLEINAPEVLFADNPKVQQVMQMRAQAANASAQKPPSTSINFKDLPPDGQAQLAKQAGLELDAEAVAAFNENEAAKESERSMLSQVKTDGAVPKE
jgi:hypothetical protein